MPKGSTPSLWVSVGTSGGGNGGVSMGACGSSMAIGGSSPYKSAALIGEMGSGSNEIIPGACAGSAPPTCAGVDRNGAGGDCCCRAGAAGCGAVRGRDELEAGDEPHVGSGLATLLRLQVPRRDCAADASKAIFVLDLAPITEREVP